MSLSADDLFSPSLDASDDLLAPGRPLRLQWLVVAQFFAGWPGGLGLFGWNYRQLGMRRAAHLCWSGAVALTAFQGWLGVQFMTSLKSGEASSLPAWLTPYSHKIGMRVAARAGRAQAADRATREPSAGRRMCAH